jgi:hypothetical protein
MFRCQVMSLYRSRAPTSVPRCSCVTIRQGLSRGHSRPVPLAQGTRRAQSAAPILSGLLSHPTYTSLRSTLHSVYRVSRNRQPINQEPLHRSPRLRLMPPYQTTYRRSSTSGGIGWIDVFISCSMRYRLNRSPYVIRLIASPR